MSERVAFVQRGGTRVLMMDLSGLRDAGDVLPLVAEARRLVGEEAPNSVRTLVDVGGARFDAAAMNAIRELAAHNRPFVVGGAVVGLSPLHRVIYQAVLLFSGRTNLRAFDSRAEAERWLATL